VCRSLCERYDRTVHLHTDDVYGWIRMGYIDPWKPGSARQNVMVSRAAARAAGAFAQEGYGVFIDGVIGPAHLPVYLAELGAINVPVHFALLLPSLEEVKRRASEREKRAAGPVDAFERVYEMFAEDPSFAGRTFDTGGLSAERTADLVMAACGAGDCLVLAAGG
jgi:hypothetical protein